MSCDILEPDVGRFWEEIGMLPCLHFSLGQQHPLSRATYHRAETTSYNYMLRIGIRKGWVWENSENSPALQDMWEESTV